MEDERVPMLETSAQEHAIRRYSARRRRIALPALFLMVGLLGAGFVLVWTPREPIATPRADLTNDAMDAAGVSTDPHLLQTFAYRDPADLLAECHERYFTQPLDHFVATSATYQERYFVCDKRLRRDGVIFFYVGNEADVELYLNNTGLMWENANEFGALLVFAEHRYFGKSIPYGAEVRKHMEFLSSAQALADYADLISHIKYTYQIDMPVIGFGGSYGGMLSTWFRMKYPHIVDGVIAASAPILAFLGDQEPVDEEGFARVVTFDASPDAGSSANCVPNVRRAWKSITTLGKSKEGRKNLATYLGLCEGEQPDTKDDVKSLASWAADAFNYMAMGNYPYPSSYIMNGVSTLPAYPVRAACSHLNDSFGADDHEGLLRAFRDSIAVYYNSTKDQTCFKRAPPSNESAHDGDFWQYLYCSELYMPSSTNGVNDMFWNVPLNISVDNATCKEMWGVQLRPQWAITQYGGRKALAAASNIVLSNGNYDPWSATGVLANISDSVVAVPVDGGAHHLDLFFSHPLDPPAVTQARAIEKQYMWRWVHQFYAQEKVRDALPADSPSTDEETDAH